MYYRDLETSSVQPSVTPRSIDVGVANINESDSIELNGTRSFRTGSRSHVKTYESGGYAPLNLKEKISIWDTPVPYYYISNNDEEVEASKIGFRQDEIDVIVKAMSIITQHTCIEFEFEETWPVPDKMWLLLMKESNSEGCQQEFIKSHMNEHHHISSLVDLWDQGLWEDCFPGAYVPQLGARSPSYLVVSDMEVTDNAIGLLVHELLHVLGVPNIHTRPGECKHY